MKPKRVLGKGLSALIEGAETVGRLGDKEVRQVSIDAIVFNPNQPRKSIDSNKLQELAESIVQVGVLQPVLLRRVDGPGDTEPAAPDTEPGPTIVRSGGARFSVVAGERRVRAARLAGVDEVPAIICTYAETEALKIALLENIQREDLGPVDEAEAYRSLMESYGAIQEELAEMLGKNRSTIANSLRLLTLEPEILEMLQQGQISRGHAKALLGMPAGPVRLQLARLCQKRGLSVRECERRVHVSGSAQRRRVRRHHGAGRETPEIRALRERAEGSLGAPVKIERRATDGAGTLSIKFFSDADLERVLAAMGIDTDLS